MILDADGRLLVWVVHEELDQYGNRYPPWVRGPRPVPCAETWYRTFKAWYPPEAVAAARAAGWTGRVVDTAAGQVLEEG